MTRDVRWSGSVAVAIAVYALSCNVQALAVDEAREQFRHALSLLLNTRVALHEEAAQEFRAFIETHPEDASVPLAHYWLGEAYLRSGQDEAALREHSIVVDRYPGSERFPEALFRVGELNHRQGRYAAAILANGLFAEQFPAHELAEAVQERDVSGRIALLHQLLEEDPEQAVQRARAEARRSDAVGQESLYILGALLFNRGDFKGAAEASEFFLDRYPAAESTQEVRFNAAAAYLKLENDERALSHLQRVQNHRPAETAYLRGTILLRLERRDGALKEFAHVAENYPDSPFWSYSVFELGRAGDADARKKLIATQPGTDLSDRMICLWASDQIEEGNYAGALKTLAGLPQDSQLRADADRLGAGALYRQGIEQEKNNDAAALTLFTTLALQYPANLHAPFALLRIGALTIDDDRTRAFDALERLVEMYPAFDHLEQAKALIAYGRYSEAWEWYESDQFEKAAGQFAELVDDAQHGADALYVASLCYQRLNRYAEQEVMLRRLLEEHPDFKHGEDVRYLLGEALVEQRKWQDVATFYTEIAKTQKDAVARADARLKAGMALYHLNQLPRAKDALTEAATAGEPYVRARATFTLGEIELNQRNYEEAKRLFLKVAVLYEHETLTPASLLEAAKCMRQLGEEEKAKQLLESVVKDYPEATVAGAAREMLR